MDRLSTENFLSIFSYLPSVDKFECNLVCKRWNDKITHNPLLYKDLTFKDYINFANGLEFFKRNPELGIQVRQLCKTNSVHLKSLEELNTMFSIFSNVREVNWSDTLLPAQHPVTTQANWIHVEKLIISSHILFIGRYLLYNRCYSNLKYLDLKFLMNDDHTSIKKVKEISTCLHYAPSLETLIFRHVKMSQMEVELIHDNTPKLKVLKLIDVSLQWMYTDNSVELSSLPKKIATSVSSFSITISPFANIDSEDDEVTHELVENWINYIGKKYKNIEELNIEFEFDKQEIIEQHYPINYVFDEFRDSIHNSIVQMLSNMTSLTSYCVLLHAGFDNDTIRVMDSNGLKLKRICMDTCEFFNTSFYEPLVQSSQARSLEELVILTGDNYEPFVKDFFKITSRAVNNLYNLTSLEFRNCFGSKTASQALIYTLRHLKHLQHLTIDLFCDESTVTGYDDDHVPEDPFEGYDDDPDFTNNLKSLTMNQFYIDRIPFKYQKVNSLFEKIWKICPLLEEFKLHGSTYMPSSGMRREAGAILELYFTGTHLKSITIDMNDFDFYQFDELPGKKGKYWKDYYHQSTEYNESYLPFYTVMKLSWKGRLNSLNLKYLTPQQYQLQNDPLLVF